MYLCIFLLLLLSIYKIFFLLNCVIYVCWGIPWQNFLESPLQERPSWNNLGPLSYLQNVFCKQERKMHVAMVWLLRPILQTNCNCTNINNKWLPHLASSQHHNVYTQNRHEWTDTNGGLPQTCKPIASGPGWW